VNTAKVAQEEKKKTAKKGKGAEPPSSGFQINPASGAAESVLDPFTTMAGGALVSAAKSIFAAKSAVQEGMTVYRVFGDEAGALGRSWTPVNPGTVSNYRNAAGLPAGNSGRFVVQGTLNSISGVTTRAALRIGSNAGGLSEIVIPRASAQVDILRVMGANPRF